VPEEIANELLQAVLAVPRTIFFSEGLPRKDEIKEFDEEIVKALFDPLQWDDVDARFRPFFDTLFEVDIASIQRKILVEVEKGKLPRLELDILKIASACVQFPHKWQFGAIIVPSSYIKLPLVGRQTPAEYLPRLTTLIKPVLAASHIQGLLLVSYRDPRGV
jgi:hypothetical protein